MSHLSMNYSMNAQDIMTNPEIGKIFTMMRRAGVEHIWLSGYFYGHHESTIEQFRAARRRVLDEGFQTGIISLPVGHPGNSLNPDDPTLDLAIHKDWTYRVDKKGNNVYFCSCIDDVMIGHNREAAQLYAQLGFDRHFFDDDLRMGSWGNEVQGCFCDRCIDAFNKKYDHTLTREQLALLTETEGEVREEWIQFNCDKLTRFMCETQADGMTSGIMVMHNGGRIHGISIPDIKRAVPGCLFRVGELHFDDRSYEAPGGKESLAASVRNHMSLIGDNPTYSESTVFPAAALSPANLIDKIRLEITLGLRNIFLMSGTWFLSEEYWKALADHRKELQEFAAPERH